MSLDSINNIQVQSVILDTVQKKESPVKSSMSVFTTVNMGPRSGGGSQSSFDNLRVRVVVSYGRDSCQMMDYLTQRMQEYKSLSRKNPGFGLKLPPSRYISLISCKNPVHFLPTPAREQPLELYLKRNILTEATAKNCPQRWLCMMLHY